MNEGTGGRGVLLTSAGTGVGNGVLTAIARSHRPYHTVVTNSEPFNAALVRSDCFYLTVRPGVDPNGWLERLIEIISHHGIRLVIPCRDEDVLVLARNRQVIEECGAALAAPRLRIVEACIDKLHTPALLQEAGLAAPATCSLDNRTAVDELIATYGFPLIAKPRIGTRSAGIRVVESISQIDAVASTAESADAWILQEYLPIVGRRHSLTETMTVAQDREYSVHVLADYSGRVSLSIATLNSLEYGMPIAVRLETSLFVQACINQLAAAVTLREDLVGPLNLQGRQKGDEIVFFEANPRCTAITGTRALFGINEVDSLWDLLVDRCELPAPKLNSEICVYRDLTDFVIPLACLEQFEQHGTVPKYGNKGR